jgi:GDP-4-dehydro-6-deoxy-D-mannose reductase
VVASDLMAPQKPLSGVQYREADLLNATQISDLLKNIRPDFVVNLAAISSVGLSWKIPQKTMEVNVLGTLNLLESIHAEVPACRLLLVGSSEEYAIQTKPLREEDPVNANNPYGISKIAQENFASLYRQKYGMSIICTRSFNHTGVGQTNQFVIPSFCEQVAAIDRRGKPGTISVGNLSAYRDISDVRDVVQVYRLLLENPSEHTLFNVGSGNAYKIEDLLKYIISLSSQPIEIAIDPQKMRPVDNLYHCCDNTRIRKYWKGTDIHQTIQEIYKHYRGLA